MIMPTRLFAKFESPPTSTVVKHFVGLPPELNEGKDDRVELPSPAFLLIEECVDGVYLFRHDAQGQFGGDTWHQSVQDARDQATFEYPGTVIDWREVPSDIEDAVQFGVAQLG